MTVNQMSLEGLAAFVQVVDSGGFSAAAREMGLSTSFISKQITRLENRLGSRLLNRTTRKISLTDVGRIYFERSKQIILDAEDAERSIHSLSGTPRGHLKISAAVSFGHAYLTSVLPSFMSNFPDIQLEIELSDRFVDVVAEGFDVVIRVGDLADSSLISRRITQTKGTIVASPGYLKKQGYPKHPSELTEHDCISYSYAKSPNYWEFSESDSKVFGVKISPRLSCNSAEMEMALVLAGSGITRLPLYICEKQIAKGELIEILSGYEKTSMGIYAIYPHRLHLSAKVRAFIDFLAEQF